MRKAYFLNAFGKDAEEMAIVSFGGCNFNCPYCKRDCQYIDSNGNVIKSRNITMKELKAMIDEEIARGRRIRLSGGDPSAFPKQSKEIAEYVFNEYGQKISIAHNGSNFKFVESIIQYLEYIAMDYKAFYPENIKKITGIKNAKMQQEDIINLCKEYDVLVDVRTPIFGNTDIKELREIAKQISKHKNVFWTLRKYNQVKGCDFEVCDMDYVVEIAKQLKSEFPDLKIGTRNYWKGGFEIY